MLKKFLALSFLVLAADASVAAEEVKQDAATETQAPVVQEQTEETKTTTTTEEKN